MNKKKQLGQFFTPSVIAEFMADLILGEETETVLDPAVGLGVFLKTLEIKKNHKLDYTAYDVDKEIISLFKKSCDIEVDLYNEDYLISDCINKYDSIICNPPYKKFQEIPNRKQYITDFKEKYGIKMSGYSNLCVYFLIKSLNELKTTGKCAYIIPYEFLNAGYGEEIKKYLLKDKRIKKIFKFNNKLNLFSDVTTTSCILFFDGDSHDSVAFISIDSLEELYTKQYKKEMIYSFNLLNPKEKWSNYFKKQETSFENLVTFKEIAKVKRGIATGNNDFFCLNSKQISYYNLSGAVQLKCISKSADVKSSVFTDNEFLKLENANKKVFLFDGSNAETEADFNYIEYGEKLKVNERYLNSHRNPWYSMEERDAAPIWFSVFSRNRFKVVRNETATKNLTTFHGIYLNRYDENMCNILFCYLLTPISQKILCESKREYGDGLDKFEPNDLNNAKVLDISKIKRGDINKILRLYEEIKNNDLTNETLQKLDKIFSKYIRI